MGIWLSPCKISRDKGLDSFLEGVSFLCRVVPWHLRDWSSVDYFCVAVPTPAEFRYHTDRIRAGCVRDQVWSECLGHASACVVNNRCTTAEGASQMTFG